MGDFGPAELRQMQGLAQEVMALRPELLNGDATLGELAWVWGKDVDVLGQTWCHRLWPIDDRLAGWGWARLPFRLSRGDGTYGQSTEAQLVFQVHPDRPELVSEVVQWYDEVAGDGVDRLLILQSADTHARAVAESLGYVFDADGAADDGDWIQFNVRDLDEVPDPSLPDGFRFVTAEEVSTAAAAKAHRDAWQSTSLTEAALTRVQETWPYRKDLHVLMQAPDGTLAATAIVWLDELTQTAEFEPVGTHPDFRRQGLGTALQLHGMHRAKAAGATRMYVACIGAPGNPAAKELYYGVGFRELSRDVPLIKTAS